MDRVYRISAPAAKFNAMLSCLFCPHRPASHGDRRFEHSLLNPTQFVCCFSFLFGPDLPVFTSWSDVETDRCIKSTENFFLFVFFYWAFYTAAVYSLRLWQHQDLLSPMSKPLSFIHAGLNSSHALNTDLHRCTFKSDSDDSRPDVILSLWT